MTKQKMAWSCRECGHTQPKWTGVCTLCQQWNSFEEQVQGLQEQRRFQTPHQVESKPIAVCDVAQVSVPRLSTRMADVDRLLGGGIVPGALALLAGDPGIGKSTLTLQISHALASQGLTVLYVCGEESVEQTSLRARRLEMVHDRLFLLSETLFSHIKLQIERLKPDVLIVDSIQILYKSELPSTPGSVSQVRELATEFMHIAKGSGIATILIGHVTKSGEIAGPRLLEHIVDVVLEFEGDRHHGFRVLRSIKNRFGPTEDIALFQMGDGGLSEVHNPSEVLLKERMAGASGSVIAPTIEGSRALLVEVQALVAASSFATPTRRSSGLDQNRLAMLLAVLEKRMRYQLHHCDVFVSIAGGLKILEPAIDLAILLAIASSFSNRFVEPHTIMIGEVGLGGEVRSVPRIESRIKEAIHLGFQHCIVPKRNLQGLSQPLLGKISCQGVAFVDEAVDALIT